MKRRSDATYGNQRPIAFVGSPCSAICVCATSYSASPIVCRLLGQQREPAAHREDPERDRAATSPSMQVDDRLRDREVERAEVDRDPLVLLELRRRVEVPPREGGLRREERERREDEQDPEPRQATACRSRRRARDRARTCTRARSVSAAASATSGRRRAPRRARRAARCTLEEEPEGLHAGARRRRSAGSRAPRTTQQVEPCRPSQSTAASAQPAMLQPTSAKTGSSEQDHDRAAGRGQQVVRLRRAASRRGRRASASASRSGGRRRRSRRGCRSRRRPARRSRREPRRPSRASTPMPIAGHEHG